MVTEERHLRLALPIARPRIHCGRAKAESICDRFPVRISTRIVLLACLLQLSLHTGVVMCAENDFYVAFDSFNSSDSDPARTRERRKEDVITQVACGDEEAFLKALREDNTGELEVRGDESRPDKTGEDVIRILIAKAEWLGLHPNEDTCSVDEAIAYPGRPPSLDVSAAIFNRFDNHAECTGYRRASKRTLQRACLKYQINAVIRWINQGRRQPGSDDLPCIRVGEDLIGTLV